MGLRKDCTQSARLALRPVAFAAASEFIRSHHRHHLPPRGWKFGVAVELNGALVGVLTVGRPVARALDDGWTAEVTRCCTDGTPHAASKLYAAAWRACRALGYRRLLTYTLVSEPGTSLTAAGWKVLYQTRARPNGWDTPARPRTVKAPTVGKTLWEMRA